MADERSVTTATEPAADATVIDEHLLTTAAGLARSVPGVAEAVAFLRTESRPAHRAPADPAGRQRSSTVRQATVRAPAEAPRGRRAEVHGGTVQVPPGAPATLQEALHRAAAGPADRGTMFLDDTGREDWQSYRELLAEAQRVLAGLRAAGLRPGDSALFQFASNRNYITAFWACVLGGFLPTPVAVAPSYQQANAVTRKLHNAWRLLDRPVLLTDQVNQPRLAGLGTLWGEPSVRVLAGEELARCEPDTDWYPASPDSPVLHLLTSGSTGVPKCVRHTNATVAARTYGAAAACGYGPDDITMNWMPLDHVAIVMYNVRDVFLGCRHINATVNGFLSDPLAWLTWIDRYRATNTWAPNFAYAMVNERAADVSSAKWDLSCMRAMTNAAEPVVARTAHRFLELLAPFGLPADAMRPCWGMSETCSGVTYASLNRHDPATGIVAVDKASIGGQLRLVDPGDRDTQHFVEVGPPIPGLAMRITDGDGTVLAEDCVGSLEVSGQVIMPGYYNNDAANIESRTTDGWFRTGDLAFLHNGSLVISGREKDQIIVRGANYLAHELEFVVERVDGVEVTFVAAAAVPDPDHGSDRLAVFFVPSRSDVDPAPVVGAIRAQLVRDVGLAPDFVVPVSREEFPKTASGKIQRGQLVAELRAGTFDDRLSIPDDQEPEGSLPDWFFERVWLPADPVATDRTRPPDGVWLVFDVDGLWSRLRDGLADPPAEVITVTAGSEFARSGDHGFQIVPGDAEQLHRVFTTVRERFGPIGVVLHGWGVAAAGPADATADQLDRTALSILLSLRELASGHYGAPALLTLTTAGVRVRDGDRLDVVKSTLPGLLRTAAAEHLLPVTRLVDLPTDRDQWPGAVLAELAAQAGPDVVAYRDGRRWVPRLRSVRPGSSDDAPPALRAGGLYLITGGLGGIAAELARYLLAAYQARLLLVGRTPVTAGGSGHKAEMLAELAEYGDVHYATVDVADTAALRAAVSDAEHRWDRPLDGVLHLAGADVSGQWARLEEHTLARESVDVFATMYRAKVFGTIALGELLTDRPGASLVLFSSVNAEFGGSSFGAYSSANSFLGGFADYWAHERGRPVHCLAWSMWTDAGMNAGRPTAAAASRGFRPIDEDLGLASFLAAMAMDRHQLVIGLDRRNPHVLAELAPDEVAVAELIVAYTAVDSVAPESLRQAAGEFAGRLPVPLSFRRVTEIPKHADGTVDLPRLRADQILLAQRRRRRYVEPTNEVERNLARLWADVLHRPRVGRDDSFFELGGNSLRAAQLVTQINDALAARLSVNQLYERPTVAQLAECVPEVGG